MCAVLFLVIFGESRVFDRGLTTGGSASKKMQKKIINDNKRNGYFLIVNPDFVSDHVIYIIPLHEYTLSIKITFSVDLCVRLFGHHSALFM